MFTQRNLALSGVLALLGLAASQPLAAQTSWQYSIFRTVPFTFYGPVAINNAGTIAGYYSGQVSSGVFIAQGSQDTTFGDHNTVLNGINNNGVTTGYFYDAVADVQTPYVRAADGTFSFLPTLVYADTPQAINDKGTIVGWSTDDFSTVHGAIWSGGVETTSDFPGATDTAYYGINNAGEIVGDTNSITGNGPPEAFVLENGVFTPLSVPGATLTFASGINNADQILGSYQDGIGNSHGFLLDNGVVTTLDFTDIDAVFGLTYTDPGGKVYNRQNTFTNPMGFNDNGDFVGVFGADYVGANGSGSFFTEHGFVATVVPEPGSIALMVSMAGAGLLFRKRHRK